MKEIKQQLLIGERALFQSRDLKVSYSTFNDGESPLKESKRIDIDYSIFGWKYALWYCKDINVYNSTLLETARSGIWYTDKINIKSTLIEAPKTFRRSKNIYLENVEIPNAQETLWNCENITMNHVNASGDYFGLNSNNWKITDFTLSGNYGFDGVKNIEIHHSKLVSKDAFWNCENVTVYDSIIIGEYIGWNSKNVTFVNCTISSTQGLCYIDNLVMKNCILLNSSLAFEYSTVDVDIISNIDSVMNPIGGKIKAMSIKELILDETKIDPSKTQIETERVLI